MERKGFWSRSKFLRRFFFIKNLLVEVFIRKGISIDSLVEVFFESAMSLVEVFFEKAMRWLLAEAFLLKRQR